MPAVLPTSYQPYSNTNPTPQSGVNSPYGLVPGALSPVTPSTITALPDPNSDLSAVAPGLAGANADLMGDITGQLSGNLSPATLNALRTASAQWGVGSGAGMGTNGMGDLASNQMFGNIAGFAENQVNKGVANYNSTIPTISGTQTLSPTLQLQAAESNQNAQNQGNALNTQIAATNALNASAPNPQQAQTYAQQLYQQYLRAMGGGGGSTITGAGQGLNLTGTGTGTGTFSTPATVSQSGGTGVSNSPGANTGSGVSLPSATADTNNYLDILNQWGAAGQSPAGNDQQWGDPFAEDFGLGGGGTGDFEFSGGF